MTLREVVILIAAVSMGGCSDDTESVGPAALTGDAGVDAAQCTNDPFENGNMPVPTGVAGTVSSRTLTSLTICPSTDVDFFEVDIVDNRRNVEALIDFEPGGVALHATLVNSGGSAIAVAVAVPGMPFRLRADARFLPLGRYYLDVQASTPGINNYQLTLSVTEP